MTFILSTISIFLVLTSSLSLSLSSSSSSSSVFVSAQLQSNPFKHLYLGGYKLPTTAFSGAVAVRSQKDAQNYQIPAGNNNYVSNLPSTPEFQKPYFLVNNYSTNTLATGRLTKTQWLDVIKNIVYTSGSPTVNETQWFTVLLVGFLPLAQFPPAVGYTANQANTWENAQSVKCAGDTVTHNNADDKMIDSSVPGLAQTYVSKKSLPMQWLGIEQVSDGSWVSVAGPNTGRIVSDKTGTICYYDAGCNWFTGAPNTTSGGVVVADADGKWHSVPKTSGASYKSWCQDFSVHVFLLCSVDTSGAGFHTCKFKEGNYSEPTTQPGGSAPATTAGGPATTSGATTSGGGATTAAAQGTTSAATTAGATTTAAATPSPPVSTPTPAPTTPSPPQTTSGATPTPPSSPPGTTTASSSDSAKNATTNSNNAAETDAPTTSPGSRAGVIFGIGLLAVVLVLVGLWLAKKKMSEKKEEKTQEENQQFAISKMDEELMSTLFNMT